MEKEDKLRKKLVNKSFLLVKKYIPHILAFSYIIYTILGFCGIDCNIFGCFFHVSFIMCIDLYLSSKIFKFCYVHRLPIYYIAYNETITCLDYYIGIPIKEFLLLIIHILMIALLIFGYSYYYIKYKLNERLKKILLT